MIIGQIEARLDQLRPSEQLVARFVLGRPTVVVHMSIADLAERAQVSEPTIMRFCKALGCVGFMDFKLGLARDLERRTLNRENPSAKGPTGLGQALFAQIGRALGERGPHLNLDDLDELLEMCAGASAILVLHSGAETPIANALVDTFRSCGLEASPMTRLEMAGRKDGLLLIALRSATRMTGIADLLRDIHDAGGRTCLLGHATLPADLCLGEESDGVLDQLVYLALAETVRLGAEARLSASGSYADAASDLLQSQREVAYADARRRTRQQAQDDAEALATDRAGTDPLGKELMG